MAIELAFRTSFFITVFLGTLYTRTVVTLSAILAVAAYVFYGHAPGNKTWQELLVFLWTWLAGVAVGWAVSPSTTPMWPVYYELSLLEGHWRRRLRPADGLVWFCALLVVIASYASLELLGYDHGTFYRLQSFIWLLLLMMSVFVVEIIARRKHTHGSTNFTLLPDPKRHWAATAVVSVALGIDILVRDSSIYKFLLPAVGLVLALSVVRWGVVRWRHEELAKDHDKKQ